MNSAFLLILDLGSFVCVANLYLSFIRYPLFCLTRRRENFRWVSGLPIVGSLLVASSLVLLRLPRGAFVSAIVLAALDTGGIHWFIGSVAWQLCKERAARKS
jgi:hypothetical protein